MDEDSRTQRAALVALLRHGPSGWPRIAAEVLDRGDAVALLHEAVAGEGTLFPTPAHATDLIEAARDLLTGWDSAGVRTLSVLDPDYPAQLREIRELPPILFTRGSLADDQRAIAVVGSRAASERGRHIAATVADALARRQVTVVSGLAAGIDTAAHEAALTAGGRTVAVIGTGLTHYYPPENQDLQDRIATVGLVISQFWPDTPPRRQQFPMRNAVMSGYAAATLVIEAGEHSGARIQARLALQHGRPVVLLHDLLQHEWARALAVRPGVSVVADPDTLLAAVEEILRERAAELSPQEGVADLAIA